ncbi:SNF2-related protein [Streptomyces sp. NPDC006967]|uniref:SNF2-related protein n=1 Tax=unclassified Streptomyces TaxID=2593676 RepID=UPI0034078A51
MVEREQRPATEEEQRTLARWSGWGALPVIFNPRPARAAFGEGDAEEEKFERAAARWDAVSDLREQIRRLLSEDDWAAARRNTINAHYTDADLVRSIWGAVRTLGFTGGRVLEPGSGSGNFIGFAPILTSTPVQMTGVEVEPTTAAIARHLYPDAEIITSGLEEVPLADGGFDGVVGNVPFGRYKRFDKVHNTDLKLSIHDHFVLKSLYATRPGGVVALITSRYTLDAEKPDARERMYQLGDLVGAVRLPARAHMAAAGTDVVTDVLFLRRRMPGEEPGDATWLTSRKRVLPGHDDELAVNAYYDAHPEYVLGELRAGSRERGPDVTVVGRTDQAPADALAAAAAAISVEARAAGLTAAADQRTEPVQTIVNGSTEGALGLDAEGNPTIIEGGRPAPLEIHADQRDQLVQLIRIKGLTLALYEAEADTPEPGETPQLAAMRAELRVAWRDYRKSHPPLTKPRQHYVFTPPGARAQATAQGLKEVPAAWKQRTAFAWIDDDPDASLLFGLEEWDERTGKGTEQKVLLTRVLEPRILPARANSHEDAVALAMEYDGGRLDMTRVASLLGLDEESAAAQCADAGLAYRDPLQHDAWEPRHRYLSGNVRTKLAAARERTAEDPTFQGNVSALERVQPADLAPSEIKAKIGAPWIPVDVYNDFLAHLGFTDASVKHAGGTVWEVSGAKNGDLARTEWGTRSRPTQDLFNALLRQADSTIQVTYRDNEGRTYVDKAATDEAQEKARLIAEAFEDWVWADESRAARLAKIYNEQFNNLVLPEYSGSALTLPGLISGWTMKEHQNAAIRRIVNEPTALLAHVVGAGKTATMAAGAMELRRTRLAKKPCLIVPNHMLKQWSREFRQLYPNAKILAITASDLNKKRRAKFMGRIAGGDWDAVILTHEAFNRVPLRADTMRNYLNHEMQSLRDQLDIAAQSGMGRNTVKQIEESLANAEAKLQQQIESMGDDNGVFLEDTGIDYLFLDEAHEYKNLRTVSAIPGAAIQGSAKATKLHMVLDYLRATNETDRVGTLATGTPIANSVTEAYVLKRYLAPQILKEMGLDAFDNWAATFGEVVSQLEPDPKGDGYKYKARFSRFFNVPELMAAYRVFADVQMAEDLDLPTPPVLENEDGQRGETVLIPPTPAQRQFIKELPNQPWVRKPGGVLKALGEGLRASVDLDLVDATEALRNLGLNVTGADLSSIDPLSGERVLDMDKVADLADAAATDMRSLGGSKEMGSKIPYAAEKIAEIWQGTKDVVYPASGDDPSPQELPGGLQLVFLDEGTPGSTAKHAADLYADLRDELVAKGMPRESIRFIHEAGTDRKKEKLFADCRSGRVRVLVGSTQKMGTGTNIQDRAVALHHLSYPWRPADMAQRDGRIERRGNLNAPWIDNTPDHVRILYYITERTFDEFRLTTLARKARFIGQIQRKDFSAREIEDIGADAINLGMLSALASGDPAILQLAEATAERARLQGLARSWDRQQDTRTQQLVDIDDFLARADTALEGMRAAAPNRKPTTGDHFAMTVGDATYRSRDAAANALGAAMVSVAKDQSLRPGERVPVGTFGGQDFHAEIAYGASGRRQMRLRFGWGHVVPMGQREDRAQWQASSVTQSNGRGAIQSLEHFLSHLDDDLSKLETSAESLRGRREEIADNLRPKDENPYRIQARSKEREEKALGKLVVANEKEAALAERVERAASVDQDAAEEVNEELEALRGHIAGLRQIIADEHEVQARARGLVQDENRSVGASDPDAPTPAETAAAENLVAHPADASSPEDSAERPTVSPSASGAEPQQEDPPAEAQDQTGPEAEPSPGPVTPEASDDGAATEQETSKQSDQEAVDDLLPGAAEPEGDAPGTGNDQEGPPSPAPDEDPRVAVPEGYQPFSDSSVELVPGDVVREGFRQYMEDRHLQYRTVVIVEGPDPRDGYYICRHQNGSGSHRVHPREIVAVPNGSRLLETSTPVAQEDPALTPPETADAEQAPLQDVIDLFGDRVSVAHIGGEPTGQQPEPDVAAPRLTDAQVWAEGLRALTDAATASETLHQAARANEADNFALAFARWAEDWAMDQYEGVAHVERPLWVRLYLAGGEQASADREQLHQTVAATVYPVLRAAGATASAQGPEQEAPDLPAEAETSLAPETQEQGAAPAEPEQHTGPSPAMARCAAVLRYYEPLLQRHKLSGREAVAFIDRPGVGYRYEPGNPLPDLMAEIGKVAERVGGSYRVSYNEWVNYSVGERRQQQSDTLTHLNLDLMTLYAGETEPLLLVDLEAILAAPGTVVELPSEAEIEAEEAAAARIVINHDAEGTEVRNTPRGGGQRIRDALNDLGFKWSRPQQKWYQHRDTPFEDRDTAVRGLRAAFERLGVAYTYNGPDQQDTEETTEAAPQETEAPTGPVQTEPTADVSATHVAALAPARQSAGWAIMAVLSEDQVRGLVSAVAVDGQPVRLQTWRLPGDRVREWIAEQRQTPTTAFYASDSSELPSALRGAGDVRLSTYINGLTIDQGDVSFRTPWEHLPAWIDAAVAHDTATRSSDLPAWRYGRLDHEIHFRIDERNESAALALRALATALRETAPPTDEQFAEARAKFAPVATAADAEPEPGTVSPEPAPPAAAESQTEPAAPGDTGAPENKPEDPEADDTDTDTPAAEDAVVVQTPDGPGTVVGTDDGDLVLVTTESGTRVWERGEVQWPDGSVQPENTDRAAKERQNAADAAQAATSEGIELRYGNGNRLVDLDTEAGHGTVVDADGAVIGWVRARIGDDGRRYWWAQDARGGSPDDMPYHESLPLTAGVPAIRAAGSIRSELHAVKEPAHRSPIPAEYAAREVRLTTAQVRELRRLVLDATYSDGTPIEPPEWVASHRKYVLNTAQMQALGDAAQAAADAFPGVAAEERRTARVLRNAAERFEFEVYDTARWRATIPPIGETDPYAGPYQPRPRPEAPEAEQQTTDTPAPAPEPADTETQDSAANEADPAAPADTGVPASTEAPEEAAPADPQPEGGTQAAPDTTAVDTPAPDPALTEAADPGPPTDAAPEDDETQLDLFPSETPEPPAPTRRPGGRQRISRTEPAIHPRAEGGPEDGRLGVYGHAGHGECDRCGTPDTDRYTMVWSWHSGTEDGGAMAAECGSCVELTTGLTYKEYRRQADVAEARRGGRRIVPVPHAQGDVTGSRTAENEWTYVHQPTGKRYRLAEETPSGYRGFVLRDLYGISQGTGISTSSGYELAERAALGRTAETHPTSSDDWVFFSYRDDGGKLILHEGENISSRHPNSPRGSGPFGHGPRWDVTVGGTDYQVEMVYQQGQPGEDGHRLEVTAPDGTSTRHVHWDGVLEWARERVRVPEPDQEAVSLAAPLAEVEEALTAAEGIREGIQRRSTTTALVQAREAWERARTQYEAGRLAEGDGHLATARSHAILARYRESSHADFRPLMDAVRRFHDAVDEVLYPGGAGWRPAVGDFVRARHRFVPESEGFWMKVTAIGADGTHVESGSTGDAKTVVQPTDLGPHADLPWQEQPSRAPGEPRASDQERRDLLGMPPQPVPEPAPARPQSPPVDLDEEQLDLFAAGAPEPPAAPEEAAPAADLVDTTASDSEAPREGSLGLVDGETLTYRGHWDGRYEITLPGTSYLLFLPSIEYRRTKFAVASNEDPDAMSPKRLRRFEEAEEIMPWLRAHASRQQTGYVFRDGAWSEAPQAAAPEPPADIAAAEDEQLDLLGTDDTTPGPDTSVGENPPPPDALPEEETAPDASPDDAPAPQGADEEPDQQDQEESVADEPEPSSVATDVPAVAPAVEDLPAEVDVQEEAEAALDVEDPPEPRAFTEMFPLPADARYRLRLTTVEGEGPREGELQYGDVTVAAVRLSASGRWFARLAIDGMPADVTELNGAPMDAARQGAVMFAVVTGEPYGEPPVAVNVRGPQSRADVMRVELRTAAEQHLRTITVAAARASENYEQNPSFQALSVQLGRLGAADMEDHGSRQMAANLNAVQEVVRAWGAALPAGPALDERQHLAFPLMNLLHETTRMHGRLQATLDAMVADRAAAQEGEAAAAVAVPDEPARDDSAERAPEPAPEPAAAGTPEAPEPADTPGPEPVPEATDQPAPLPDAPEETEMATPARPATPDSPAAPGPDSAAEPGEEQPPADVAPDEGRVERTGPTEPAPPAATEPDADLPLWTGPTEASGPEEDRPLDVVADFAAVQEAWDEHVPADMGTGADLFATVEDELQRLEALFADALSKLNPPAEGQPAPTAPAAAAPAEAEKAPDREQSADAVNVALRKADAHAPALQDLPEWQRIQSVRGAFGHLMHVMKERAGEHFGKLMTDGRVGDFVRRVSIKVCEKVAGWAQAAADKLRRPDERGPGERGAGERGADRREELPSAEALLRLGDAALEYRGSRRAGGGSTPPSPNGTAAPVDIPEMRKMGEALNRPMPGAKRGVSAAAARGRSTTTKRGKKPAPGGSAEQAGHLRRGGAEQTQARKPTQR